MKINLRNTISHRANDPASNTDQPKRVYRLFYKVPLRDVVSLKSRERRKLKSGGKTLEN